MGIEQKRAFIIRVIYYVLLAGIFLLLFKYGLSLLSPFVAAFVIVYLLQRPICFLSKKTRIPYKPVALLTVLLFYCTVGLLAGWLVIRVAAGVRSLVEMLPGFYTNILEPTLMSWFAGFEGIIQETDESLFQMIQGLDNRFLQWLESLILKLSGWAVSTASNLAMAVPGIFIQLVLMIISTFFMAADYEKLTGFCLRQFNEEYKALILQIKDYLVGTLLVCIGSYLIIMFLTFVELAIGLSLMKIPYAMLWAALIALFDILPVLGTGGVMIPWALISFVQGKISLGVGLLLLYVAITIIRNIVEPKIVGHQLGLHPVVTLASMFLGAQLLGVVGLFGFPICLSLLRYLNDKGSIHIFKT